MVTFAMILFFNGVAEQPIYDKTTSGYAESDRIRIFLT